MSDRRAIAFNSTRLRFPEFRFRWKAEIKPLKDVGFARIGLHQFYHAGGAMRRLEGWWKAHLRTYITIEGYDVSNLRGYSLYMSLKKLDL